MSLSNFQASRPEIKFKISLKIISILISLKKVVFSRILASAHGMWPIK